MQINPNASDASPMDIFESCINHFACSIAEKQDELIMEKIRVIGGEKFTDITVDKRQTTKALLDYKRYKENSKALKSIIHASGKDAQYYFVIAAMGQFVETIKNVTLKGNETISVDVVNSIADAQIALDVMKLICGCDDYVSEIIDRKIAKEYEK